MNIDKLKAVIQKANPEIMELKFGCEVRFTNYAEVFVYVRKIKNDWHQIIKPYGGKISEVPDLNDIVILGRPIRLADVLLAMNVQGLSMAIQDFGCWMREELDEHGESVEWTEKRKANWNLSDDNLDNQSDECKEFLTKLLVN